MAADKTIPHETATRAVISNEVASGLLVTAPTAAGASYVQAQAASVVTSVNEIRAALIAAGITL